MDHKRALGGARRLRGWLVLFALLGSAYAQSVYRWVDEQGRVHYSDTPADKGKAKPVDLPPPPTLPQVEDSRRKAADQIRRALEAPPRPKSVPATSVAVSALGPLPRNTTSEWMRTVSTNVVIDSKDRPAATYKFSLGVRLHKDVPVGAFVEAQFDHPANPASALYATATVGTTGSMSVKQEDVFLLSPAVDTIGCRNYEVTVRLFRNERSRELLGVHRQLIQSRIDSSLSAAIGDEAFERFLRQQHLCPS